LAPSAQSACRARSALAALPLTRRFTDAGWRVGSARHRGPWRRARNRHVTPLGHECDVGLYEPRGHRATSDEHTLRQQVRERLPPSRPPSALDMTTEGTSSSAMRAASPPQPRERRAPTGRRAAAPGGASCPVESARSGWPKRTSERDARKFTRASALSRICVNRVLDRVNRVRIFVVNIFLTSSRVITRLVWDWWS
jgi:hypothetical protein